MARYPRHLNIFLLGLLSAGTVARVRADGLDSVIAPQFGLVYLNETRKSSGSTDTSIQGTRYTIRADFASLSNNVSILMAGGFGASYIDAGLQLRAFDLLKIGRESATGLYYGAGAGAYYSPGYSTPEIPKKTPFVDVIVTGFLRLQWDTMLGFGIFVEGAYECALNRLLQAKKDGPVIDNPRATHRFAATLGIPISFDF